MCEKAIHSGQMPLNHVWLLSGSKRKFLILLQVSTLVQFFLSFCKFQGLCFSVTCTPGTDGRGRHHLSDKRHYLVGALNVMLRSSSCHQGSSTCYITARLGTWVYSVLLLIMFKLDVYVSVICQLLEDRDSVVLLL